MTVHPYPQRVVEAVAVRLAKQRFIQTAFQDLSDHDKESLIRDASDLLTALWQVDQPSTISADEARLIWFKAVDAHTGDTESMHDLRMLLAKHAPDWGGAR